MFGNINRDLTYLGVGLFGPLLSFEVSLASPQNPPPAPDSIVAAFESQKIKLDKPQLKSIADSVVTAHADHCNAGPTGGNSKVRFAAVDIASRLGLSAKTDATLVPRIESAITSLPCGGKGTVPSDQPRSPACDSAREACGPRTPTNASWDKYFDETVNLTANREFLDLLGEKKFFPVKISWEDIGRYEGSVWGDRISDVGIWVRRDESSPNSARLALSVRRDSNFRDKVLVVPAEKIKVHLQESGATREYTLPERLKTLGLTSEARDKNVIVSNQFAIVPVPAANMDMPRKGDHPPRAAFTFSIFPYGSTNYVITDVIEGSSDAIVGRGGHQLLFANVDGKKAPFTASRAEERKDLLKLEAELKAKGMDVDVQRYYLIQIPLKKEPAGITLSNMGSPPNLGFGFAAGVPVDGVMAAPLSANAVKGGTVDAEQSLEVAKRSEPGLAKVAIGHGETEGDYSAGSGFRGQRADEPIRVTVVYFVTPVGRVTRADMENFSKAFEAWDGEALWGGSFVVKDDA